MKFTIGKQSFQKELGLLQGVVEKKSTIPILTNVLIEAKSDGIEIKATDLDVSISTFCEAEVRETGSLCLPAKKLFEIVRALPDSEVELKRGEKDQVTISCERSRFKLLGVASDNFPEIRSIPDGAVALPVDLFRSMIGRTIFAITTEESRYSLNGARFEIKDDTVRMVATDGHRLAFVEKKLESKGVTLEVLIPKKTLAELARLSSETTDPVEIALHDNHLFFQFGKRVLTSRMLSGQFPNYEMVLPRENDNRFAIESHRLTGALRRVSLMTEDRSHAIKLDLTKSLVHLSAQNSDIGESGEDLSVIYDGPDISIGFNSQYLLDFFSVVSEGEIYVEFKDSSTQVQLRPKDEIDCDYRYIVMPMRI